MQADTLVPGHQGTQAFDRYAYVNNNPLRFTDLSGHDICSDQWEEGCSDTIPIGSILPAPRVTKATPTPSPRSIHLFLIGGTDGNADTSNFFLPYRDILGVIYHELDPETYASETRLLKYATSRASLREVEKITGEIYVACYSACAGAFALAYHEMDGIDKSKIKGVAFLDGYPDITVPSDYDVTRLDSSIVRQDNDIEGALVVDLGEEMQSFRNNGDFRFFSAGRYGDNMHEFKLLHHGLYPNESRIAEMVLSLFGLR